MGATVMITRDERSGERELAAELGLSVVFVALTRSFASPAFGSLAQDDSFVALKKEENHPERSEGAYLEPRTSHIALTSRNSVEALKQANLLHRLKGKEIWCVGPSTAAALGDFPHHISPGTTGQDLARFMLASGVSGDVLHICGNPHRPELRSIMQDAGCRMHEWVVYETVPVEAELPSERIDAIAFFSPSAVQQFKALSWEKHFQVPYVAIGPSTASELLPSLCTVSRDASFRGVLETTRKMLKVEG